MELIIRNESRHDHNVQFKLLMCEHTSFFLVQEKSCWACPAAGHPRDQPQRQDEVRGERVNSVPHPPLRILSTYPLLTTTWSIIENYNFFLDFSEKMSLVVPTNFQHILRVLNTNIEGKTNVMFALTSIKASFLMLFLFKSGLNRISGTTQYQAGCWNIGLSLLLHQTYHTTDSLPTISMSDLGQLECEKAGMKPFLCRRSY